MSHNRTWRWRRCPHCMDVNPASAYAYVGDYRPGWSGTPAKRQCPACGFTAYTNDFQVVRESHPAREPNLPMESSPPPPPPPEQQSFGSDFGSRS